MDKLNTEEFIDTLLIFMNDEVESHGRNIKHVCFNFEEGGEDLITFCAQHKAELEEVKRVVNICRSRELTGTFPSGRSGFNNVVLTKLGQRRALSANLGTEYESSPQVHIGTVNVEGPAQIGNHNVQNIENFQNHVLGQIEESGASEEQKKEAKSLVGRFFSHPLILTAVEGFSNGFGSSLKVG